MKKRIVSLCLAFALLLCLLPQVTLSVDATDYSGDCGDNLTWSFDPDTGILTIEGSGPMWNYNPWDYHGRDVPWSTYRKSIVALSLPEELTSIGRYAFFGCAELTSVKIPESVTSIGKYSFYYCTGLTSVTIPGSVTNIGESAFYYCTGLTSVTIPEGVTSIGKYSFYNCTGLTSVTIPEGVTSIGDYTFSGCTGLTSVTFPESVTCIGEYAFYFTGLTSVTIPERVTCIGAGAFEECNALKRVVLQGNQTYVDTVTFTTDWDGNDATPEDASWCETLGPKAQVTIYGPGAASDGDYHSADFGEYGFYDIEYIEYSDMYPRYFAEYKGYTFYATDLFSDVAQKEYYTVPVAWAVGNQITTGTSKTKFSPAKDCTREQVVTFLWRANDCPEPTSTLNPFKDVPDGQYYTKAVLWAVENGITNGKSKTKFGVGDPCNRAQGVTFLWRAGGEPEPTSAVNHFKDVSETDYFYKAVLWAVENGITNGTSKTRFSPAKTCTRGEVVTFLYRDVVGAE